MLEYRQRTGENGNFERPEDMPEAIYRLLIRRGIRSAEEAEAFLHPSREQILDPMRLNDMDRAVEIIRETIRKQLPICIYGDYDCDGVCASAILKLYFDSISADSEVYLPERQTEGYGLNEGAVREIAGRSGLLLTVDCGISSWDLVELAKELGLECVITDHHRLPEKIPDCPVVNPQMGGYPFPFLCGAGVAFKLVAALAGWEKAMEYIDIAALATVSDVVSLKGENRAIVALGLEKLNRSPREGIKALITVSGIKGKVTSMDIGFRLGPRLNAGGRLGSAKRSLNLLLQTDPFSAMAEADELNNENNRRQELEKQIEAEAEMQLQGYDFSAHRILLVHGKNWNSGVIGLAASRIRERYHYPVIAMAETEEGILTGSCRSIESVDIQRTLCEAADLMIRFGGHSQAAGLTIRRENLDAFQKRLDDYLFATVPEKEYLPVCEYDLELDLKDCTEIIVCAVGQMEPSGMNNESPVFRTSAKIGDIRTLSDGKHLRFNLLQNDTRRQAVFWQAGNRKTELEGIQTDLLYTLEINEWNGNRNVQLNIRSARGADPMELYKKLKTEEEPALRTLLTQILYTKRIHIRENVPVLSESDLSERLNSGIQGTWIVCPDVETARRIRALAGSAAPDIELGRNPSDPRAFNSVLICPRDIYEGNVPVSLRRLVFAGMPVPDLPFDNVEVARLEGTEGIPNLPDLDQMRLTYKTMLQMTRMGTLDKPRTRCLEEMDLRVAQAAKLPATTVHASILALIDMELVGMAEHPFFAGLLPMKKIDPESSEVWRMILRLS